MSDSNAYQDLKDKISGGVTASEWTPFRTFAVATGALVVIGVLAVVIIRAKRK